MTGWFLRVHGCNWILVGLLTCGVRGFGQNTPAALPPDGLTLDEVLHRVVDYNERVQIRLLELEASRRLAKAEKGIFEPAVVASVDHLDSEKPSNVQEQRTLLSSQFDQRNTIYDGGLEVLSPTGAKLKTGVTLRDLKNNLQKQSGLEREYETFVGVSLVQPLLKNFGPNSTKAKIRLAAIGSDIAFQDYRRQLMISIGQAEVAYWSLYLAQEQERLTDESLAVAEAILNDNKNRAQVGRSADIEIMQAEAGVSLRKARQSEAKLNRIQGASQLATLFSDVDIVTNTSVRAIDRPVIKEVPLNYFQIRDQIYQLNPDYITRKYQILQENIRLSYAKNQRLPDLDLKASYGFNGLGRTTGQAFDDVGHSDFPVWSVGAALRIPITGGIRERNELEAAKLSQQRALVGLKEIETQIGNGVEASLQKVRSFLDNIDSYQKVVEFHQELLKSQMSRLELGRIDSRTVLETEERLFEAKLAVVDNMVQYARAFVELELITGTSLQIRKLDVSKDELEERTISQLRWSPATLSRYAKEAETAYQHQDFSPERAAQMQAVETLRKEMAPPETADTSRSIDDAQQRALQVLRQKIEADQAASRKDVTP